MKNILIALVILLGITSCEDPIQVEDRIDSIIAEMDLSFETIMQDQTLFNQNTETRFLVFRNFDEEQNFLSKCAISTPPWDVDYSEEMVIGIAMKPQPNGSNVINIDSLKLENNKIAVYSSFTLANIGTSIIGHPVHFIKLKKYDNLVDFKTIDIIQASNNISLEGTEWQLTKFVADGKDYTQENVGEYFYSLENIVNFEEAIIKFGAENEFSGAAFCNQMFGGYEVNPKGGLIELSFGSTEMACEGSTEFQQGLLDAYAYNVSQNSLVLYSQSEMTTMFFAPKSNSDNEPVNLENTQWKLIYWEDFNGEERRDVSGALNYGPQVDEVDNLLFFQSDGNFEVLQFQKWLEGNYTTSSNLLEFNFTEEHGEESVFTELLKNTLSSSVNYSVKGDSLFISSNHEVSKKLAFVKYTEDADIYDDWKLSHVISPLTGESSDISNSLSENSITLKLESSGELDGLSICNEYFGNFINGDNSFIVKPLAATKVYCPPSGEYLDALGMATSYEIIDGQLNIYTNIGNIAVLVFNRN